MKTSDKIAIAAAGGLLTAGALIALARGSSVGTFFLQVTAGGGGTTDPAPSPSGRLYAPNAVVRITAHPNNGWTVGTWLLDGSEIGQQAYIDVTMNMNHTVIVTFWEGGVPPVSAPYGMIPLTTSMTTLGYYACRVLLGEEGHGALQMTSLQVHNCDQNWTWDNWAQFPLSFKVIDASGRGVPNIPVNFYPDVAPDSGNSAGIVGFLALNLYPHTRNEPLQVVTDSAGIATLTATYTYFNIQDHFLQLCRAANLSVTGIALFPFTFTPYDGQKPTGSGTEYVDWYLKLFYSKGGEGITAQTPSMGNFVPNYIHAYIPNTAIQAQTQALCGFHVKML